MGDGPSPLWGDVDRPDGAVPLAVVTRHAVPWIAGVGLPGLLVHVYHVQGAGVSARPTARAEVRVDLLDGRAYSLLYLKGYLSLCGFEGSPWESSGTGSVRILISPPSFLRRTHLSQFSSSLSGWSSL
jgi:hypothetical protein